MIYGHSADAITGDCSDETDADKALVDREIDRQMDYVDWGQEEKFKVITEVGECAGVIIDLVSTLIFEAEEKLNLAQEAFANKADADAIYHAYASFLNCAKGLLISRGIEVNTHLSLLNEFETHFDSEQFGFVAENFKSAVLKILERIFNTI